MYSSIPQLLATLTENREVLHFYLTTFIYLHESIKIYQVRDEHQTNWHAATNELAKNIMLMFNVNMNFE